VEGALRILIVDDHRAIRDGLEILIREQIPHAQAGKARDLRDAFALATHGWDVVLLDINLPDGNGIEAVPALRAILPEAAIIIMTALAEPRHLQAVSELGAATLLEKSELFERLGDAISAACATQREGSA
jgi:DNA-binding NarL/FixJ family response regulator